jgi:hypothetical protein
MGTAINGQEAPEQESEFEPEAALQDMEMTLIDGVEVVCRMKERPPSVRVLPPATFSDRDLVREGTRAGTDGYLLNEAPGEGGPAISSLIISATLQRTRGDLNSHGCGGATVLAVQWLPRFRTALRGSGYRASLRTSFRISASFRFSRLLLPRSRRS